MGEKGAKRTGAADELAVKTVETLSSLGEVRSKKMFGGYGLFENDAMFGMVTSKADVYLKANPDAPGRFEAVETERHGKMPYFRVPDDVLESDSVFRDWARDAVAYGHATKKR